ncbi:type IV pilus assembly protein PilM [Candidatus Wolfebacteria bacterium]|nr:type IV pilus assembly protein PilM [Candidatus Wolfebacteria bacterium]
MFESIKSFLGKSSILGVDIGTTAIKIAEIIPGSSEKKSELKNYGILTTFGHLDRPNSALQANALKIAEKETADFLKKIVSEGKFTTNNAVASISPFSVFIILLEMPVMPEADLRKAMSFQIRQHIPLSLSEVAVEWNKVGERETDEGVKQQILLIAIPNEIIRRYQNIFKLAGLNLKFLEIENLSLIRALIGNDPAITLIADIGGRSTNIMVIDRGFLKFSVYTDFAGASLTSAIANGLGINMKRAEELKKTKGLKAGAGQEELSTLPLPYLDAIIGEIQIAKNNFERTQEKKIEKLVLCGGGAKMAGINEYIEKQTGMAALSGNALSNVGYPPQVEILAKELGEELTVAIGLGIKKW